MPDVPVLTLSRVGRASLPDAPVCRDAVISFQETGGVGQGCPTLYVNLAPVFCCCAVVATTEEV